jgi:hypothetical protein
VSDFGDVLERARRNGAVDATPFFLDPWGRADPVGNAAFWRAPKPGAMRLKPDTVRGYAFSLKVWLDFLHVLRSGRAAEPQLISVASSSSVCRASASGTFGR